MAASLLIKRALVLDPVDPVGVADIRISAGLIAEIGPNLVAQGEPVVDGSGRVAMPGLVNAHTHSGQSLDRGLCPMLPLDLWMMWAVYGAEEPSPDTAYITAAAGALEMLRTGCTSVLDHVYLPVESFEANGDAVMSAYADVGIRASVAPMVEDLDFVETLPVHLVSELQAPASISPPLDAGILAARVAEFLDRWTGRSERLTAMLGPDSPQRCSDELLGRMGDLSIERGVGIHMHLLEARSQLFACRRRFGSALTDRMKSLGLLRAGSSFAHAVWLEPSEYRAIAAAGAVLVHNPVSNLRLGSGIFPLAELLAAGVEIAIGTDGGASNDDQDLLEALKVAAILQTARQRDHRKWIDPKHVWQASLAGGAIATASKVGRIATGHRGDVVLLESDADPDAPKEVLLRSLILGRQRRSVDTVVTEGEVVIDGGSSTRMNESDLQQRLRGVQRDRMRGLPTREQRYREIEPFLSAMVEAAEREPLDPDRAPGGSESPNHLQR